MREQPGRADLISVDGSIGGDHRAV